MNKLSLLEKDRIIEMAWEDRTTFDAIKFQFGLRTRSYSTYEVRDET